MRFLSFLLLVFLAIVVAGERPGASKHRPKGNYRNSPMDGTAPSLGPLVGFLGKWAGSGFNTIFVPAHGSGDANNLLTLTITAETLEFVAEPALGSIANRGFATQPDVFLEGLTYMQRVSDVMNPANPIMIHLETGLWVSVPATDIPLAKPSVARMGSVPHGTTIMLQGPVMGTVDGEMTIPPLNITPTAVGGGYLPPLASQDYFQPSPNRRPQVLVGSQISEEFLDNPNSFLTNTSCWPILQTTLVSVTSAVENAPDSVGNIDFLRPNAKVSTVNADFYIELIEFTFLAPVMEANQLPVEVVVPYGSPRMPSVTLLVSSASAITSPTLMKATFNQLRYSQTAELVFNGAVYPHVSVAVLIPAEPITVNLQ